MKMNTNYRSDPADVEVPCCPRCGESNVVLVSEEDEYGKYESIYCLDCEPDEDE